MAQSDITITIRKQVAWQMRKEHPYMKTATLEKLLDSLTSNLRDSIENQNQELEATKARANFFMLPAELRNVIYELVLVASVPLREGPPITGCITKILRWGTIKDMDFGWVPLEILRTTRQVRQEELPIFLGANTFQVVLHCDDAEDMLQQLELKTLRIWRDAIGKTQFAMIKNIDLQLELDTENILRVGRPNVSESKIIIRRYASAICKRAGTTPEQLRADSPIEEWNTQIVKQCLPLEELGLGKANVQLTISASAEGH